MSMIKKSTTKSKVVVSSTVYLCNCGYTEIGGSAKSKSKKCPKCGELMNVVTSQEEPKENNE